MVGFAWRAPIIAGDETYVRNLTAAKREPAARLRPEWKIDFGFNADAAVGHHQMPQILKPSGHMSYMFAGRNRASAINGSSSSSIEDISTVRS